LNIFISILKIYFFYFYNSVIQKFTFFFFFISNKISQIFEKKIRNDIAFIGQITLDGIIEPVGGIKNKLVAALENGIKTVFIPADNLSSVPRFAQHLVVPVKKYFRLILQLLLP